MLTERRRSLMRRAARKRRRKPTLTICVASTMLPTTVMKSNAFHGSLKYGCGREEKWVWNYLLDNPVADHNREGEMQEINTGSSKINGAKLSDACSVRATWLCMGWPFCLVEMGREFQTGGNFFCTTL